MRENLVYLVVACLLTFVPLQRSLSQGASFEEAVVNVGNVGITVTNAGFIGKANIRNNPTGPPSFEYPLDSGVEHLFESGIWIGTIRSDGTVTVRTGAVTTSAGYQPGATGYEMAQVTPIARRSSLSDQDAFTTRAVSHQDYLATFVDTATVLPGTLIEMPDVSGQIGAAVNMETYAWNFPFTEYFAIVNFDIVNIGPDAWDSVYVGLYHDLVVRNVNTTTETGSAFFNKGGYGFIDSLQASYAFNAGGPEQTLNTYASIAFLGAEWTDPATMQRRFMHPEVAGELIADGYSPVAAIPRWWLFSAGAGETARPNTDLDKYRRMSTPFPNPADFESEVDFMAERESWYTRLRTDGTTGNGNWIGLTSAGPFASVASGDTLRVTFGLVAATKPDEFQGLGGKPVDNADSRALLANNILWARRTYAGEDNNYNGALDAGEDANGNGRLDRYLIPEPPGSPRLRVEFEEAPADDVGRQRNRVLVYWDRSAEQTVDPVSGEKDFEGYRIYRSDPGEDRGGNILDNASLIAQYDRPGNRTGFNSGFDEILLDTPVTFPGDTTSYWYRLEADNLLGGWQYAVTVTAFDTGDPDAGLESFESSRVANAVRVFPGTPAAPGGSDRKVGVYPNPYRVQAAWDGATSRTRKLNFYNLPANSEIRVYSLAGEIVAEMAHDGASYAGDIRWYDDFSAPNRVLPGGEHSWDILSENGLNIASGLYLYTVKDLETGDVQRGKFAVIK